MQHQAVSRAGGPSPQADCYPCSAGPTSVITAATAPVTTWGPGAGRRSDKQTQFPQTNPPPRRPGQTFCVHFPWRGRDSGRCCGELSSGPPLPPFYPGVARDDTGILNQTKWLLWCQPEIMNLPAGQHRGAEPGVHNYSRETKKEKARCISIAAKLHFRSRE